MNKEIIIGGLNIVLTIVSLGYLLTFIAIKQTIIKSQYTFFTTIIIILLIWGSGAFKIVNIWDIILVSYYFLWLGINIAYHNKYLPNFNNVTRIILLILITFISFKAGSFDSFFTYIGFTF